jgi:hypothetical protein
MAIMRTTDRKSKTGNHTNEHGNQLDPVRSVRHTIYSIFHEPSVGVRSTTRPMIGKGEWYPHFEVSPPPHHLEKDTETIKARNRNPPIGERPGSTANPRHEMKGHHKKRR